MKTEYVYRCCQAPLCNKKVRVKKRSFLKRIFGPNLPVLCPEHRERMTNGRVSDNDSSTNPDLDK